MSRDQSRATPRRPETGADFEDFFGAVEHSRSVLPPRFLAQYRPSMASALARIELLLTGRRHHRGHSATLEVGRKLQFDGLTKLLDDRRENRHGAARVASPPAPAQHGELQFGTVARDMPGEYN